MGTRRKLIANVFVPIYLLPIMCCLAQAAPATPAVVVEVKAGLLNIHVAEKTSLSTVLDEACRVVQATCTGTDLSTSVSAAPMSISGTWTEIIDKLLQGSALDYVAVPSSGNERAQLIVTRPTDGPESVPSQAPPYGGLTESSAAISPDSQISNNETSDVAAQATPPTSDMATEEPADRGFGASEGGTSVGAVQSMPPIPQDPATAEDFPTESSAPDSGGIVPHAVGGTPESIPVFAGNGVEASPVTPKPADKYMPLPPF
jgi:hypothetical protein